MRTNCFPGPDGRDVECVQVGKSEGWLAEAVTGRHVSSRCLGRTGVFDEMRTKFNEELAMGTHGGGVDLMAGLDYNDEDAGVATPRPRKKRKAAGTDAATEQFIEKTPSKAPQVAKVIKMRPFASADAETVNVTLMVSRRRLLLSLPNLPWLMDYLRQEMEEVPAVDEASDDEKTKASQCLFWDFHNVCWVARKKTADGEMLIKKGYVERRLKTVGDALHGLAREEAKRIVHEELYDWLNATERQVSGTATAQAV